MWEARHAVSSSASPAAVSNPLYLDGPAERFYALAMGRRMRRSVSGFVQSERTRAEAASA